jgi:APA family basic amino acid/polyamine antiporter
MVLRVKSPELPRPFRTPLVWVSGSLGVLISLYLMLSLPMVTWIRLFAWLAIGLVIYFFYGKSHSRVQKGLPPVKAHD